jgi:predicted nuclease of predicted toxin-antitoxin system
MNILADENISLTIVERLRKEGHQIRRVAEIAPRSPDTQVLAIARQHQTLLLTEDKDFGKLVMEADGKLIGVFLIRLKGFTPPEKAERITEVIRVYGEILLQAFTVITPRIVRVRPYSL